MMVKKVFPGITTVLLQRTADDVAMVNLLNDSRPQNGVQPLSGDGPIKLLHAVLQR